MMSQRDELACLLELVDYPELARSFAAFTDRAGDRMPAFLVEDPDQLDREDWEVEGRGATAGLYDLFGLIEIGILSNALPEDLPDDLRRLLNAVELTVGHHYYDVPKPGRDLMFRLWNRVTWDDSLLNQDLRGVSTSTSQLFGPATYHNFLDLTVELEADPEVLSLFSWLQQRRSRPELWSELVEAIDAASESPEILFENDGPYSRMRNQLWGLVRFLVWSEHFQELLDSVRDDPLLQSSMWSYHSRWLDLDSEGRAAGEAISHVTRQLLTIMQSWGGPDQPESADLLAPLDSSTRILFSKATGGFGETLSKSTQEVRESREKPGEQ